MPDYGNYLVFIFTQLTSEDIAVRTVAGLILKNHLHMNYGAVPPEAIEYIKHSILTALVYKEDSLRRTATQVVTMLMGTLGPANWQEGLEKLITLSASQEFNEAEVSVGTSFLLCVAVS